MKKKMRMKKNMRGFGGVKKYREHQVGSVWGEEGEGGEEEDEEDEDEVGVKMRTRTWDV